MPFQFYCPQGHLLEGHEQQMGQQGQCPMCGAMFMFPVMGGQPGAPGGYAGPMHGGYPAAGAYGGQPQAPGQAGYGQAGYPQPGMPQGPFGQPGFGGQPGPGAQGFGQQPGIGGQSGFGGPGFGEQGFGGQPVFGGPAPFEPAIGPGFEPPEPEVPPEPRVFRILCPKGHELQTPEDMLGTQALCPYCNTQMELRYEDSVEYKKQKETEQRIQDEKTGRFWMTVSIWAAVIVGLLFVGLVVMMFMK